MKKYYFILLLVSLIGFQSCDELLNDVVPDVNTTLSKTFQIQIYQNTGTSTEEILDISNVNEYEDFKNIVKGYELTKITYQIKNANVPDDMYFSGSVTCKNEDSSQTLTAGNFSRVKISEINDSITETEVTQNLTDINTLLGWIESAGKFKVISSYALTNGQNAPYPIEQGVAGSNFEILLRFYIVVKTGV